VKAQENRIFPVYQVQQIDFGGNCCCVAAEIGAAARRSVVQMR